METFPPSQFLIENAHWLMGREHTYIQSRAFPIVTLIPGYRKCVKRLLQGFVYVTDSISLLVLALIVDEWCLTCSEKSFCPSKKEENRSFECYIFIFLQSHQSLKQKKKICFF